MRYFLAIILPPVAVLLCGKPVQALLILPLCFWIPGVVHALFVVNKICLRGTDSRRTLMLPPNREGVLLIPCRYQSHFWWMMGRRSIRCSFTIRFMTTIS